MGKRLIEKLIIKILPKKVQKIIISNNKKPHDKYSRLSYAQEGEDLLLDRIFGTKKNGFYVDVGAHHPRKFSNTYIFYKKGWRGINIDVLPGSMDAFKKERPEDINLEIGISDTDEELEYFMFNQPAINTFSHIEAERKLKFDRYHLVEKRTIRTKSLKDVLSSYLSNNQKIDFMSIDVEGLDLQVIRSNDWAKYRPSIILIEDLAHCELPDYPIKSKLYEELVNNDYELFAKTYNTLFFKSKEFNN